MKNFFYILGVLPLFLVSCSKEEEENVIDPTIFNKNISVGESCTINEVGSISLETPNDFIVTINGNKITGNHSGALTSYCNTDKGRFKLSVTVSPNTTLYVDLAQFLGMSKSNVEKVFGKPIKTTSQHCVYAPSGLEKETGLYILAERLRLVPYISIAVTHQLSENTWPIGIHYAIHKAMVFFIWTRTT